MIRSASAEGQRSTGSASSPVSFRDVVRGLREIGLDKTSRVVVHASLSSFGQVAGGAETIVGALTAVCGTVIAPAFTYQTMVVPRVGPADNGIDYDGEADSRLAEFWRPDLPAHKTIGAIPNTLLRHPDAKRSSHPALSFVAVGPEAQAALDMQSLDDPFAPLAWLADHSGDVVLLGVTHRTNTMIHVGERRAGRRRFVRWALTPERIVEFVWPGDSSGFDAVAPAVKRFTRRGQIGTANVQRVPARELVSAVEALIRSDPNALLCNNPACARCRDVRGETLTK